MLCCHHSSYVMCVHAKNAVVKRAKVGPFAFMLLLSAHCCKVYLQLQLYSLVNGNDLVSVNGYCIVLVFTLAALVFLFVCMCDVAR